MIPLKLRSRKGTSLIVALFLLIVCSTVGSIILTAATANAGRISERAEYDRKYYKVISAARLFADKIAEKNITLTFSRPSPDAEISVSPPLSIPDADDKLSAILLKDIYAIYTGGKDSETIAATAKSYWEYDFSNIGRDAGYIESVPTAFTMEVLEDGAENPNELSTVYGRFAVEAKRMKGDIHSGLDSVEHNVTAVFYSDEDTNNQIPESAYVVKLVCPAEAAYPTFQEDENGERLFITFKWSRDNMKIEQVRGVA